MQTIVILVMTIAKFDPMLVKEPLHLTYFYALKEYTCVAQNPVMVYEYPSRRTVR